MKWRVLNAYLPHRMNSAFAIAYGNSFVIIGGDHFGTCPIKPSECHSSKYIYAFNEESYDLEIRSSTMQTNRGNHLVVSLPRNGMCCHSSISKIYLSVKIGRLGADPIINMQVQKLDSRCLGRVSTNYHYNFIYQVI